MFSTDLKRKKHFFSEQVVSNLVKEEMERIFKSGDRERMKRAMLQQEQTFRQQVRELHQLYRVQKQLMRDQRIADKGSELRPRRALDSELPAKGHAGDAAAGIEDEGEIELTLGIGNNCKRRKREETSNTSDSGGSQSSSSAESVSLKLLGHNVWGMSSSKEPGLHLSSAHRERGNGFDVEDEMRQNRIQNPSWLLLKMS